MDEEAVKALKTWLDEGKAPDDFRRVNGWSKASFEESLEAAMKTPSSTPVAAPTSVVEDDDE